jgi:flagellar hook-basal body complex protein FliE
MTDPLGLIGNTGGVQPIRPAGPGSAEPTVTPTGPSFRETLEQQIAQVNELQHDATAAMEDLATGQRDDVESVILATQKADIAFRTLLQVRNKMMEAYDEVKQIRV